MFPCRAPPMQRDPRVTLLQACDLRRSGANWAQQAPAAVSMRASSGSSSLRSSGSPAGASAAAPRGTAARTAAFRASSVFVSAPDEPSLRSESRWDHQLCASS